jgi:hypothetical protein
MRSSNLVPRAAMLHLHLDGDLEVRTLASDQRVKRVVLRRQHGKICDRMFTARLDAETDVRFLRARPRSGLASSVSRPGRSHPEAIKGCQTRSAMSRYLTLVATVVIMPVMPVLRLIVWRSLLRHRLRCATTCKQREDDQHHCGRQGCYITAALEAAASREREGNSASMGMGPTHWTLPFWAAFTLQ